MNLTKNTVVSDNLNLIRGIAALSVLFAHVRNGLFVPYANLSSPSLPIKIFYFFSGLGREAVMIFFVLSGFLIGAHVYYTIKNNIFSWKIYLTTRLVRLYVVLIPALIFSACIVFFGAIFLSNNIDYSSINLRCFSLNFFFLQTIFSRTYAGNAPLWSLCNEFWYYVLFPFIVMPVFCKSFTKKSLCLAIALAVLGLIGIDKSLYFCIWFMGFAIYLIKPVDVLVFKTKIRGAIIFFLLLGLMCEFILSRFHVVSDVMLDFLTAIFFSTFLYMMLHDTRVSKKATYSILATRISSCSYTLYLIHYPIVTFIGKIQHTSWQPDTRHVLYASIIFVIIVLFSYWFSSMTEAKTNRVRAYILERLSLPVFFKKLGGSTVNSSHS